MIRYLLDTNIVSELTKPAPAPACLAWLEQNGSASALSATTLAELKYGIERLAEGKHKQQRARDFDFLLEDYKGRFFDFDGPAAVEWGRYAAALEADLGADWWKTFDFRDTAIAAIAREYGLAIVTRNARHFPLCEVVNPFAA
jgi:predicted nucleic acid-binding protein